mmetsp:Transcript_25103/g.99863  ORF Transcript_25103/g.99863 Transcript_25103/m.99863 type:complete len:250 (-) Transcript_25103:369-1118(-)
MAQQDHVAKPLTPPCLKRYTNCPFDASGHRYLANECRVCVPTREECEAQRMACKVMKAYEAQPIHGEPLVLPNGVCVAKDVWALKLSDDLFEKLAGPDPLAAVQRFDLERWLDRVIAKLGTPAQMAQFKELVAELERLDEDASRAGADAPFHKAAGLPSDLGDVVHQPYLEVDAVRRLVPHLEACRVGGADVGDTVYRSLSDVVPAVDDDDEEAAQGTTAPSLGGPAAAAEEDDEDGDEEETTTGAAAA